MHNESYMRARHYVIEMIDDALDDQVTPEGSRIEIEGLEDFDCVPISAMDNRKRQWRLKGTRSDRQQIICLYESLTSGLYPEPPKDKFEHDQDNDVR